MTHTSGKALALALALSSAWSAQAARSARTIAITVTQKGFVPSEIRVRAGEPLRLEVTRKVAQTCATEIVLQGTGIRKDLLLDKQVEIDVTPARSGTIRYACSMGMLGGVLVVE